MTDTLALGLRHAARMQVTPTMLVPALADRLPPFADMPSVLATAILVGFIEATCIEALRPHLRPGEHSVGIHVDLTHSAPTSAGMEVRAEVELTAVAGRILTFAVRVSDNAGPIGEGSHRRALIDRDRFAAKVAARAATAA